MNNMVYLALRKLASEDDFERNASRKGITPGEKARLIQKNKNYHRQVRKAENEKILDQGLPQKQISTLPIKAKAVGEARQTRDKIIGAKKESERKAGREHNEAVIKSRMPKDANPLVKWLGPIEY